MEKIIYKNKEQFYNDINGIKRKDNPLKHIAIIPDGNRRWAGKKKLQPWQGHEKGVEALEKILEESRNLKIPYITFWAGSSDNFKKRPKKEISFLFRLYKEQFKRILQDKRIEREKVRVNVLGSWPEILPLSTVKTIKRAIDKTKHYNNYFLTFLLGYNGTDEMLHCIKKIARLSCHKRIKINGRLIKENLWTGSLPQVDLLIRTGVNNDPHMSAGFMMWQTAYAQLYFSPTLFPDFDIKEFKNIIKDYSLRERRFGS